MLWHAHYEPDYRIPYATDGDALTLDRTGDRLQRVVAVVSHFGGGPRNRDPQVNYRNGLITSGRVELYGSSDWSGYRQGLFSLPRLPKTYRGELPASWSPPVNHQLLKKDIVPVCLEKVNAPGYFTEKSVGVVLAVCIPVYRASDDIRETVLKRAK
ncbi:MAG: hypothetical protein ACO3FE_10205 [Planctomycetaceae bacterium]